MKKYILSIAAFALAISCQKETPMENELTLGEGIPVTVEVGAPEEGNSDAVETKISESISGKKHTYTWEAGDAFRLVAYAPIKADGESTRTDCGDFVTAEGGSKAKFGGTIPADMPETYTEYWAVAPAPKQGDKFIIPTSSHSGSTYRYLMTMDIAETQDGTGLKYAHFCSKGKLSKDAESGAWSFASGPAFAMAEAMLRLGLEATHEITKIEVSYELYDASSKAAKKTALAGETYYATNSTGTNSSKTSTIPSPILTIYDGGNVLPQDIYFVIRHQAAGAAGSKLNFTFYKADGSKAEKSLALTAAIGAGKIYPIGTLNTGDMSFSNTEVKIVWNAGDAFTAPEGAGYTEFPSAVLQSGKLYATLDGGGNLLDRYTFKEKTLYFDLGYSSGKDFYIKENLQAKLGTEYLFANRDYLFKGYTFNFGRYYAATPSGYSTGDAGKIRLILSYIGFPAIEGKVLTHAAVYMNRTNIDGGANKNPLSIISANRAADTGSDTPTAYSGGGSIPSGRAAYVLKSNGKLVATSTDIATCGTDMKLYESYCVADFSLTGTAANTMYYFYSGSTPIISKIVLTYDDPE